LVVLAVIGMLSAAAGAYYYLRIVVVMYFGKPKEPIEVTGGWPIALAVTVCVILTVLFGINSAPISSRAHVAAQAALAHPQPDGASVAKR
jgi:NADH-quinone oxidoreductase subunit N